MYNWIYNQSRARRDELLSEAARTRLHRHSLRGRSLSLRNRIAGSALNMSERLAVFAHAVREKN
ncbi:MAG: hypothetical protein DLM50_03695 [Candidatus Meridianibacter frigidus]|nr:MAG: hypothetical protein DLM50_03695 [Candidatus Eremiobacteraeota bacterium]